MELHPEAVLLAAVRGVEALLGLGAGRGEGGLVDAGPGRVRHEAGVRAVLLRQPRLLLLLDLLLQRRHRGVDLVLALGAGHVSGRGGVCFVWVFTCTLGDAALGPPGRGEASAASSLALICCRSPACTCPADMLCTRRSVPGLPGAGPGLKLARCSSLMLSATLGPRRVTTASCAPPLSGSSSLWRRCGGGGGRNSMLPRGVVVLLCPASESSQLTVLGVRLVGGAGLLLTWLQLRLSRVPRPFTPEYYASSYISTNIISHIL